MMLATLVIALAMQAPSPDPFQPVAQEMMSKVNEAKQAAVRTADEWSTLWRQHAGGDAPKVDFASRTVVAVFLGERASSGYSVEFVGTKQTGGVLTVLWRERRPDRGDITAQVITSPMKAVTIPKFAGEIRFEKVEK